MHEANHLRNRRSWQCYQCCRITLYSPTWPSPNPSPPLPPTSMQLEIFTGIYSKLTGKHVTFEFHASD